ncbi:MAG TPA: flagellar filament capping protein FliD [Kineosporiaceae bacterium]|nr:flagellar filament capping protein FliD [Kineosporiaceae bacterium]
MSQMSISGAVSGLDTASLINQLVSVQQAQQTLLATKQSKVQKTADAYGQLITQLNTLSTLSSDLAKTSAWQGTTATSSDTSVTATASGTTPTSITFDVTDIARAHTLVSANTYTSLTDVASTGSLTLTHGATATTINVGTGSLSDVVSAINNSGTGFKAAAVQVAPGQYRLQVASSVTGADSAFTLTGPAGFSAMNILTTGTDARIHIGTDPMTAYDATSSTNTFSSLVPGLSFTVSKPGVNGVTVGSTVDGSAIAAKVQKMVDAANTVLNYVGQQTAYDAVKKTGGPLLGESAARALQQNLLSAVSTAGAAGVHVTRDGTLTFSQTEFTAAYAADANAVAQAFGAKSAFARNALAPNTAVTLAGNTDATRGGTYAVKVTQAAQRESWTVTPAGGNVVGHTINLSRGATLISFVGQGGDTIDTAVAALNQQSAAAGLGITAVNNAGVMTFSAAGFGAAGAFSVTFDAGLGTKVTAGQDVAGTINGAAATGLGDVLSLTGSGDPASGLSLKVSTTAADIAATTGNVGSVTYTPGLAQRFATLVSDATNSTTGSLVTAQQGQQTEIKDIQDQIDSWNLRLTAYRETLTRQFTTMETTLAQLKSSMSAISGLSTNMLGSTTTSSSG